MSKLRRRPSFPRLKNILCSTLSMILLDSKSHRIASRGLAGLPFSDKVLDISNTAHSP